MNYQEIERQVPQEFKNLLTDVVAGFLVSSSTDFVDFAANFFNKRLQAFRTTTEDELSLYDRPSEKGVSRRRAVIGDSYAEEELSEVEMVYPRYPKKIVQIEKLHNILEKIVFFKTLGPEEMETMISAMQLKMVSEGEYVITEGEDGDFFYAIEEGTFVAVQGETVLKEYVDEGSFGELALMYNVPRACSVKALTNGTLWALDRRTFQKVLVSRALNKRRVYNSLIERVPMLEKLSDYERANLADAFEAETYSDGELIIREGDPADKMYFIEQGSVVVKAFDRSVQKERELNRLEEGDYFGELALINKKPRAANVYAEGHVKVVFVTVETFERLLGPCMDIMRRKMLDYDKI